MQAQTIAQLAWYKPRSKNAARLSSCTDIKGLSPENASDIIHYAECHKNLQLGWDFAADIAASDTPFPAILHGDDLIVWRAYRYILGADDPVIAGALSLNTDTRANTRNQVRALLISDKVDCEFVAENLALPLDVVKAYEKLFFNVIDRKKDHAYIANLVFPEGRITEAFESYLENTGLSDLLLRAGYVHGYSHVLYAAGLGPNPYSGKSAAEGASMLDDMFMADGCLYASYGWMHQRQNAVPITNARLSMQASKMGNGDINKNAGTLTLGDTVHRELVRLGQQKAEMISRARALNVVPVVPLNNS